MGKIATVAETKHLIGQVGDWRVKVGPVWLTFQVTINDVRAGTWGRTDYLIQPVRGDGEGWVSADSVALTVY